MCPHCTSSSTAHICTDGQNWTLTKLSIVRLNVSRVHPAPDLVVPFHPFYGYYFRRLDGQGPAARGGAKPYVVKGRMTNGFAYVAYPSKYDDTGIMTFIVNHVVYEKNFGKDTDDAGKSMTEFNPDNTWTAVQ
jgi:Protein of unknown function (DUF2950)